jgi:hypothetical protein
MWVECLYLGVGVLMVILLWFVVLSAMSWPLQHALKVKLVLRVESNSRWRRGQARTWGEIEEQVLCHYTMERSSLDQGEYYLTLPYETEVELEKFIYHQLFREAVAIANTHHCDIEADVQALDGSRRHWFITSERYQATLGKNIHD